MSLSPKDDPRTWVLPGPRAVPRPPLHARLLYYDLTTAERALLSAMFEHAPEGGSIFASPNTYALNSGLSVRHIWNLIHGRERNGRRIPGFIERGILSEDAKGKGWPEPKAASYRFNEAALHLLPEVMSRHAQGQLPLPGIPRPSVHGDPGESVKIVPTPSATVADDHRQQVPTPSAMVADDSKTLNSRTLDSREKHHASGALSGALKDWFSIKEKLKTQLSAEEWNLWVRPARLLKVVSGSCMLIAVPASNPIMLAAKGRQEMLHGLARSLGAGYHEVGITRYPDDYQLERAAELYPQEWGDVAERILKKSGRSHQKGPTGEITTTREI